MDKYLSVEVLRAAYRQAILNDHDQDFIQLIREELIKKEADSSDKTLVQFEHVMERE
ncbi:sporulation histidine kinase inhibitor Sda [Alkalicoccobacillus gibsonii]|uniref:Sporulation histidine kinase inhibitor Sda n=1 Tax=Alkalicoccobacillus gibsonii TaxID=79881 RepID=A0ABU9VHT4_9BACI|nr:sporulation histidine kinase inhibitor Sda [Alkalicoccobacillus gibsonii]MBM0064667.1 sporulation histidine kinase inhibitor Sda [Alkalicoccobacillus gibsonii]